MKCITIEMSDRVAQELTQEMGICGICGGNFTPTIGSFLLRVVKALGDGEEYLQLKFKEESGDALKTTDDAE
jgi:hypothetical protein